MLTLIRSAMCRHLLLIAIILALCVCSCAQARNQATLARNGFVNDFAEVLDLRARVDLEEKLRQISENEGLKIYVATVKTTGNITAADFSRSLAQNWKIGSGTKPDYTLLLLAAIDDGVYYTEAAGDAAEIFSAEWLDKTQKQMLVPEFQSRNYTMGLSKTVDAYASRFTDFREAKKKELERRFQVYEPTQLLSGSTQAIVVRAIDWNSLQGTAQLFERTALGGDWTPKDAPFPIVVGNNGLAWSEDVAYLLEKKPEKLKKEGDGRAPAGIFSLTFAFGAPETPAGVKLPYTKLDQGTECVDDTNSAKYNQVVNRFKIGNFDWSSSEKMLAVGAQYELGVFVAHNSDPVKTGGGSCIFLHIWKSESSGTAGCTAMKRENIEAILGWLDPSKQPKLIQLPAEEYDKLQNTWKLPKVK